MEQEVQIQESGKGTQAWLMIAMLLFFPPVAWYLMWKEKKYHIWFVWILWLYGGLVALSAFLQIVFVIPKLLSLYEQMSVEIPQSTRMMPLISIGVGLAQIALGFAVKKEIKKRGDLTRKWFYLVLAVLIFNFLAAAYLQIASVNSVVFPLYNLTSHL